MYSTKVKRLYVGGPVFSVVLIIVVPTIKNTQRYIKDTVTISETIYCVLYVLNRSCNNREYKITNIFSIYFIKKKKINMSVYME